MNECEQCGNPTDEMCCPFCGFEQSLQAVVSRRRPLHVVKVKEGMPLVHEALDRMLDALDKARVGGAEVLLVVHGYGSSGRGGEIRRATRKRLAEWVESGRVSEVVHGEAFRLTREQRKQIPDLERHLARPNEGVTLVRL